MSIQTIELAMEENISIIKLPSQCTDLLQPLDVACFSPPKSYYEKHLTERVHQTGAREPLKKSEFVDLICKIWKDGMTESNIKSGITATGIFPVDKLKYKISRLDSLKLKTYNRWLSIGSPTLEDGSPDLSTIETLSSLRKPPAEIELNPLCSSLLTPATSNADPGKNTSSLSVRNEIPSPSPPAITVNLIKELQKFAPSGMRYVVSLEAKETRHPLKL